MCIESYETYLKGINRPVAGLVLEKLSRKFFQLEKSLKSFCRHQTRFLIIGNKITLNFHSFIHQKSLQIERHRRLRIVRTPWYQPTPRYVNDLTRECKNGTKDKLKLNLNVRY